MKLFARAPKPRSDAARALADPRYKNRVVRDKKKYSRKGRNSSMRKFEDSIQPGNHAWLIEWRSHDPDPQCRENNRHPRGRESPHPQTQLKFLRAVDSRKPSWLLLPRRLLRQRTPVRCRASCRASESSRRYAGRHPDGPERLLCRQDCRPARQRRERSRRGNRQRTRCRSGMALKAIPGGSIASPLYSARKSL